MREAGLLVGRTLELSPARCAGPVDDRPRPARGGLHPQPRRRAELPARAGLHPHALHERQRRGRPRHPRQPRAARGRGPLRRCGAEVWAGTATRRSDRRGGRGGSAPGGPRPHRRHRGQPVCRHRGHAGRRPPDWGGRRGERRAAAERDAQHYGIVEDYVGHGIGTEMHMDPQIPNHAVRDSARLFDGFTGAIEPMVTLGAPRRGCWTTTGPSSRSTEAAPPTGRSVAVRDDGLWILTASTAARSLGVAARHTPPGLSRRSRVPGASAPRRRARRVASRCDASPQHPPRPGRRRGRAPSPSSTPPSATSSACTASWFRGTGTLWRRGGGDRMPRTGRTSPTPCPRRSRPRPWACLVQEGRLSLGDRVLDHFPEIDRDRCRPAGTTCRSGTASR